MPKIRDQLKCGNCGEENLQLYNHRWQGEGRHKIGDIEIRCPKCATYSFITVSTAISLSHPDDSDGAICGGWTG